MKKLNLAIVKRRLIGEKQGFELPQADDPAKEDHTDRKVSSKKFEPKAPKADRMGMPKNSPPKLDVKKGDGSPGEQKNPGRPEAPKQKAKEIDVGRDQRPNMKQAKAPGADLGKSGKDFLPAADTTQSRANEPTGKLVDGQQEDKRSRDAVAKEISKGFDSKSLQMVSFKRVPIKTDGVLKAGETQDWDQSVRQEKVSVEKPKQAPKSDMMDGGKKPKAFGESRVLREYDSDDIAGEFNDAVMGGEMEPSDLSDFALRKAKDMASDPHEVMRLQRDIISAYKKLAGDVETDDAGDPDEGMIGLDFEGDDSVPDGEMIEGVVEIHVSGRKKLAFEAATTGLIGKIAREYTAAGQPIEVVIVEGTKPSYGDKMFARIMTEAARARLSGMKQLHGRLLKEGLRRFRAAIQKEYSPFYFRNEESWNKSIVVPAFARAIQFFESRYARSLKPFDVVVRARTRRGVEDFDIVTEADSATAAVRLARDEVLSEAGIGSKFVHAFVGGKKYLPEDVEKSLLGNPPDQLGDLPKGDDLVDGKQVAGKAESGPKPKVQDVKMGSAKAKFQGYDGSKTAGEVKVSGKQGEVPKGDINKTGKPEAMKVDKKIQNELEPKKDKGPQFAEGTLRATIDRIAEKIEAEDRARREKRLKESDVPEMKPGSECYDKSIETPKDGGIIKKGEKAPAQRSEDRPGVPRKEPSMTTEESEDVVGADSKEKSPDERSEKRKDVANPPAGNVTTEGKKERMDVGGAVRIVERDAKGRIARILAEDGTVLSIVERDAHGRVVRIVEA
jgi:hypothetical protein